MSRGFLAGAGWGTVVAGLGLVVASQVTDLEPGKTGQMPPAIEAAHSSETAQPPANEVLMAEVAAEGAASDDGGKLPPSGDLPAPVPPQDTVPDLTVAAAETDTAPVLPDQSEVPVTVVPPSALPAASPSDQTVDLPVGTNDSIALPDAQTSVDAPKATAEMMPAPDGPAAAEASVVETNRVSDALPEVLPVDAPPVGDVSTKGVAEGVAEEVVVVDAPSMQEQPVEAMPAADPEAMAPAGGEVIVAEPEPTPAADSIDVAAAEPAVARPSTGFGGKVDGVKTGRLPSIGAAASPAESTVAAVPAPAAAVVDDPSLPAIQRYARAFDNSGGKPLFAILLQDTGGPEIDREALAAIPFPVSFIIDPTAPDAATAAQIYRAAGQEVLMLGSGIPTGGNASDIAVGLEAMASVLPEAVALVDKESGGFQGNRTVATQVLALVSDQGRGVISWDRGLNAASQVARRDGMRSAVIFRALDAGDESSPVIRRYLDRAAFKAAQDGRVVVAGKTRPETVTALLEWAVEGRAATVAIAPSTAVMQSQ